MSTLIKTWLAPYEVYLWAGLAVLLLVLGVSFVEHERTIGANEVKAADARAVAAETKLKLQVEADAQKTLDPANAALHVALDGNVPVAPIVVRVCPVAQAHGSQPVVPADGPPDAGRTRAPPPRPGSMADVSEKSGANIGPTTEELLAKADAEIKYWRAYYADCVARKICKPVPGAPHK
jgi:hypothetical protein